MEHSPESLHATQGPFPDLVRLNHGHPAVEGGGEDDRKKTRRMGREQREVQGAAGDDGEKPGGDIREAEGSGDPVLNHTGSSEDEAAVCERTRKMRFQDEMPSLRDEGDDDFEDEVEQGVP